MKSRNIDSSQVARSQYISDTKNEGELLATEKKQLEKKEEEARRGIDRSATAQALTGGGESRTFTVWRRHIKHRNPLVYQRWRPAEQARARLSIGMR
jgi:hypothetical protein